MVYKHFDFLQTVKVLFLTGSVYNNKKDIFIR